MRRDLPKVLPPLKDTDPDFAEAWSKVLRSPLDITYSDEVRQRRDGHPEDKDNHDVDGRPCLSATFLDELLGISGE